MLVGVNGYSDDVLKPLQFAAGDAAETAEALKAGNFQVTVLNDAAGEKDVALRPTRENILKAFRTALNGRTKNDTVFLGFAGHGMQFTKEEGSFICPVDCDPRLKPTLIGLKDLYQLMDQCGAGVKLLLIDACRDDPGAGRGINDAPEPPSNVSAMFSCAQGQRASVPRIQARRLFPQRHRGLARARQRTPRTTSPGTA